MLNKAALEFMCSCGKRRLTVSHEYLFLRVKINCAFVDD